MQVFDRIIGNHIDNIPIHEVFDAFISFSAARKATIRPKITSLLLRTLIDHADQLLPNQIITISEILLRDGDKLDENGKKVPRAQANEYGSEIIKDLDLDKFILNQIGSLNQADLVRAVEIFADSTLLELQQGIQM